MSRMRRGLVHAVAWTLATGAAVTLSWWGVHTVLAGTAYDPPRALPLTADATERTGAAGGAEPESSSTRRPERPSDSGSSGDGPSEPQAKKPGRPTATGPGSGSSAASGEVKSYDATGGRAVFELGRYSAELVSATPDAGWRVQVWKQSEWIRVNFTKDARTTSVFCTWNGHAPTVQVVGG
ncbi:hypothetical protein [Streptomyces sp. NPDC047108]|uniref:hypothetical protein n=1 Tax=Streptomyces sp. NPDC047108 TaxID=3155025 RepID=UPI0033C4964E